MQDRHSVLINRTPTSNWSCVCSELSKRLYCLSTTSTRTPVKFPYPVATWAESLARNLSHLLRLASSTKTGPCPPRSGIWPRLYCAHGLGMRQRRKSCECDDMGGDGGCKVRPEGMVGGRRVLVQACSGGRGEAAMLLALAAHGHPAHLPLEATSSPHPHPAVCGRRTQQDAQAPVPCRHCAPAGLVLGTWRVEFARGLVFKVQLAPGNGPSAPTSAKTGPLRADSGETVPRRSAQNAPHKAASAVLADEVHAPASTLPAVAESRRIRPAAPAVPVPRWTP